MEGGREIRRKKMNGGAVVEPKQLSNWGFRVYKNVDLWKRLQARERERNKKKIGFCFN